MTAYPDTGFLCSLYAPDAHTARAIAALKRRSLPLAIIWLHQLELRNALRLRVFRGEIDSAQCEASLRLLMTDLAAGMLAVAAPPLQDLTNEAERLSAQHAANLGTRTLDTLHVAAALVLGAGQMLTFDARQTMLARAAGLKVPKL
jgi:predicted nucleic acid-binding protein